MISLSVAGGLLAWSWSVEQLVSRLALSTVKLF
jgi:hypothetical protein